MTGEHDAATPAGAEPGIAKLVVIGLVASVLFSVTFILNYTMHLSGGHWYWSGALRYLFTIGLLLLIVPAWLGPRKFVGALILLLNHLPFWILIGTVGFGVFYAGVCFAADYARGWVVAATWQTTILATPFVLLAMGFKFPRHGILFSALIVCGAFLVNIDGFARGITSDEIKFGVLPILVAAFAYPIGNQLLNAAKNGTLSYVPHIRSELLKSPLVCILNMSLGSVPFWLVLYFFAAPPPPAADQWISTFVVALLAGIGATGLFIFARNLTSAPYKIAAVDATLSGEVFIPLLFEIIFLGEAFPDAIHFLGLLLIVGGLIAYTYRTTAAA